MSYSKELYYPYRVFNAQRDPTPEDSHWQKIGICIGDMWFNTKNHSTFVLVGIKDNKREWESLFDFMSRMDIKKVTNER